VEEWKLFFRPALTSAKTHRRACSANGVKAVMI
jgi:hypothetical protein